MAECIPTQSTLPVCLSGTVVSPGYSGAVIEEKTHPGLRSVNRGDAIGDWTVGEIRSRYITLTHGTQTVRLDLMNATGGSDDAPEAKVRDEPSAAAVRKGPVRHTRSLARGGE